MRTAVNVIIVVVIGLLLISVTQNMPIFGEADNPVPTESGGLQLPSGTRWLDSIGLGAVVTAAVLGVVMTRRMDQGEGTHHE